MRTTMSLMPNGSTHTKRAAIQPISQSLNDALGYVLPNRTDILIAGQH